MIDSAKCGLLLPPRIGISGWLYPPWRGVFYPPDLPQKKELFYASRQVASVEINGSFYSLQKASSYLHWYEETPDDFIFSVKGPRFVTHIRRLKNVEEPLANFFGSGVLHLREKLGPFLWQLPPRFNCDLERLETFFKLLPKTIGDVDRLLPHANRVKPERPSDSPLKFRHALEVRDYSFENPEFIDLLRKYAIALVFADTAGKWPYIEDVTSDFIYIRLHGEEEIYSSGYGEPSLQFWASRIRSWQEGGEPKDAMTITGYEVAKRAREVFVYFDNDAKVRAPFDAIRLSKILGLTV